MGGWGRDEARRERGQGVLVFGCFRGGLDGRGLLVDIYLLCTGSRGTCLV